jgi:hypothetical protein
MPGRMVSEDSRVGGNLKTSNEPSGPIKAGDKGSVGDQAFKDAVLIVGICWVIVFFTIFSLRRHSL